jgi:DNA-binding protein YbaB
VTPAQIAHARFQARLREVEEDLARLRGARERMTAVGVRARERAAVSAAELTTRVSQDGLATVTCTGTGAVRAVQLDTARYNGADDDQLCAAVLQARQQARSAARQRSVHTDPDLGAPGA